MRKKNPVLIIFGIVVAAILIKLVITLAAISPLLWQLLFTKDIALRKTDDHINILLLGIGGGTHEGPDLTDSIIFASVDPATNKVTMVSIPRDLWLPELHAKINTTYALGEKKQKGGGIIYARGIVGKILNQPVDYVVRIDFDGFVKAVDLVGGLDITVEHTFDDYEYPIEGKENDACGKTPEEVEKLATSSSQLDAFPCRYKHIHFDKGKMHMNGITSLTFVRSRHALGPEGTDFARSKRQEKIITAFKDTILSAQTVFNPAKILSLYQILKDSIDTNITQDEFDDFLRLAQKMKHATIQSVVIDYGDEETKKPGLLVNPPISPEFGNQWVLTPRVGNGNYIEIQSYISCQIKKGNCPLPTKIP